jgi:simple sugar transport system substrate-binding protein
MADPAHGTLVYTAHEGTTHLYRDGLVTSPWGTFDFVSNYCKQVNAWTSTDDGVNWYRNRYLGSTCPTSRSRRRGPSSSARTRGRRSSPTAPAVSRPAGGAPRAPPALDFAEVRANEVDRAALLRLLTAAGAGAALAGAAPALADASPFPGHPRWKFVFVSPETTSPLFVPTQYGIQDACDLLGCTYEWTGSPVGAVRDMVRAIDAAVSDRVGGIAVSIVDAKALDPPIGRALAAGIPVVAFSLLDSAEPRRVAFVGQDPYGAGWEAGERLAKLVGRGEIVAFAPRSPASQQRLDGLAEAIARARPAIALTRVRLDNDPLRQAAQVDEYLSTKKGPRGLLATDITSTDALGRAIRKHDLRVKGGGYGVLPATLKLIADGRFDFTMDEEPYLLGFMPTLQLFLSRFTGGLVGPVDVDTGLRFVTKANVKPYLTSKTRYEGSSSKRRYPIS